MDEKVRNIIKFSLGDLGTICFINPEVKLHKGLIKLDSAQVNKHKTKTHIDNSQSVMVDYFSKSENVVSVCAESKPKDALLNISIEYKGDKHLAAEGGLGLNIFGFSMFKKGLALHRKKPWWTQPSFVSDIKDIPSRTQFFLWDMGNGLLGCMMPLCSNGMVSALEGSDKSISLNINSFDEKYIPMGETAALTIAVGNNPYDLVKKTAAAGMKFMGNPGRMRWEKDQPDFMNYLGWCSWNAFYTKVDEKKILESAKSFQKGKIPVKYFIIDDGWQNTSDWVLNDFAPNKKKFPSGLKELSDDLKANFGLKYLGMWHTLLGYWGGVNKKSELYKKYSKNMAILKQTITHPPLKESEVVFASPENMLSFEFFNDLHSYLRSEGVDFVKVDSQSSYEEFVKGKHPVFDAVQSIQYSLQGSASLNFRNQMINCMSMSSSCVYNCQTSNIIRNSDDFFPKINDDTQTHTIDNVYNALWTSQFAVPDYDMFQSHHAHGEYHAVLRAISGGPVYVSDVPGKQDFHILKKVVLHDGRVPKLDGFALATVDCLFDDPAHSRKALKVFNKKGNIGLLGIFNTNKKEDHVTCEFSPSDINAIVGDDFFVYDFAEKKSSIMKMYEKKSIKLSGLKWKLYFVSPITKGFAPIGYIDYYASPAAIETLIIKKQYAKIELMNSGTFLAYCEKLPKKIYLNSQPIDDSRISYKDQILKIKIEDVREKNVVIVDF